MEELWDGKENGLPYFFPRDDLQDQVYSDLMECYYSIAGFGWIQELVSEYLFHPSHVCMLSILKGIAIRYSAASPVYKKHIIQMKQVYKRSEVRPVLLEIAMAANIEIIVYFPEITQWISLRGSDPTARCKLVTTHNSIVSSWHVEEIQGEIGDIHLSSWQESYMSAASAVINEMFGVKVYRATGSYRIEGDVSRTASEAAQRVLLHALQACHLTSCFPYKIDGKKRFTACIEKYERICNTMFFVRARTSLPVFEKPRPKSAATRCVMISTLPEKIAKCDAVREETERKLMQQEEEYTQRMKAWEKEDHTRRVVHWREVMREIEVKYDIKYWERKKVVKSYVPRPSQKEVFRMLQEKEKEARDYTKNAMEMRIRELVPELAVEHPYLRPGSLRAMARDIIGVNNPEIKERIAQLRAEVKELEDRFDTYYENVPEMPENMAEIETQFRNEMRERRNESPVKKVTWVEDPVFSMKKARLQQLRNISKKSRELGLELLECQKFVRENEPILKFERSKPHKVSVMLPPRMPSNYYIVKKKEDDIEEIMSGPDRRIIKKESVQREENLENLVNEVKEISTMKPVACSNIAIKARSGLLTKIYKAKKGAAKKNKPASYTWMGIKTQRPLHLTPSDGVDKTDPIYPNIERILISSSFHQLVGSARRSLLHSGQVPSIKSLTFTNEQALALASVTVNDKPRRFLRMFLPNSISNKLCSHKGILVNQRFQ